jgi:hypothetical protein
LKYEFGVDDRVLVSKSFWNTKESGETADDYAKIHSWFGPWRVLAVQRGGYVLTVERDYPWKQKVGVRGIDVRVELHIRYAKPIFARDERAWKELREKGQEIHYLLFR